MLTKLDHVDRIHGHLPGYEPEELIYITWNFTTTCNFACTYCPKELHDGRWGFPKYDNMLNFFKTLSEGIPKKSYITMELLGGEPTMWPRLIDFVIEVKKFFADKDQRLVIMLDTNLSRTNRWFEKLRDSELWDMIIINSSYHADFCDPDLFYSNLEIISKTYRTHSNMMIDPRHFHKVKDLVEKIKANLPVDMAMKVLRPDLGSTELVDGYTEEMIKYITELTGKFQYNRENFKVTGEKSTGFPLQVYGDHTKVNWQKIIIEKKHKFKGWKCSAGSKRFYIQPNGNIFPCSKFIDVYLDENGERVHNFADDHPNRKWILGNINDNNFKVFNKYIVCPIDYCPCKIDTVCDKHKINTTL